MASEEVTTTANMTSSQNGLLLVRGQYHVIWTRPVVFRVTMLVVTMAATLIGNSLLLCTIVCQRTLRHKRVNIFLINLAVGDLMVCFVSMTTEILFVAFGEWVLGAVACKLIVYGQLITLMSATFLLTAMSIDRYQVVVKPFRTLTGPPKIWLKVLFAWLMAFILTSPQLFIFVETEEAIFPGGPIKRLCRSAGYSAQWQRKLYFTYQTACILVIPTIIMSVCYVHIIKVVMARRKQSVSSQRLRTLRFTRRRDSPAGRLSISSNVTSQSKTNVIKMTLSVIIGFVVCWSPYFVVSLVRIYSDYQYKLEVALSVAEIMALVHSAVNPMLYGIFSTKAVRQAFTALCFRKARRYSSESATNATLA